MKIKLTNGEEINKPVSSVSVHGYVATEITLYARDARLMMRMHEQHPDVFRIFLLQLANRFADNRPPNPAVDLDDYEAPPIESDSDGYLLEAALQANARLLNDDGTVYAFTQEDLLRLIKCALKQDFMPLWNGGFGTADAVS